jgi:splicing factor 3B subunit 3
MATTSNMFMYSLTIQPPSAITDAVVGKLVGRREGSSQREDDYLVTASGSLINLWKWDSDANHLNLALSHNTFSIVRALAVFRFAGSPKGMPCSFGKSRFAF